MSNNPIQNPPQRPHIQSPTTPSNKLIPSQKNILKITAVVLLVIAVTAVIATAAIGVPFMIPLGIGLTAIALESILLGAYKCISKKPMHVFEEPQPIIETVYSYDPILDAKPSLKINKKLSNEEVLDLITTHPKLSPADLNLIRKNFLSSHWEQEANVKQALNQRNLKSHSLIDNDNTLLLEQPEYKTSLIISRIKRNEKQTIPIIPPPIGLKKGSFFKEITEHHVKQHLNTTNLQHKPLNVLDLTQQAIQAYSSEIKKHIPDFLSPNISEVGILRCSAINLESIPFRNQDDRLLAQEACLLGFCLAITQILDGLDDEDRKHMSKIITLSDVSSKLS